MKIFKLMKAVANEIPNTYHGGGKGSPAPIPTPPPVAPPPEETAMLEVPETVAETKRAQALGAKTLQIPLGTIGGTQPLNI